MTLIQAKYQQLAPRGDFLKDVVILAQAWKKTHTAIRRHNWYADMLELDCSTVDLQQKLVEWAAAVGSEAFKPEPMLLVPAPKNTRWDFPEPKPLSFEQLLDVDINSLPDVDGDESFEAWGVAETPSSDGKMKREQKLRPLAHLSIRDQTLATAVMLCLADAVESAQGDTSERDGLKAQTAGVFSYGNRLHCRWDATTSPSPRAHFGWGNSRIYSQYFQDYRMFLARPRGVCAELSSRVPAGRELYVVSLDIKSFFDCVDRQALIGQLKLLYGEFAASFSLPEQCQADDQFWAMADRIFDWEWDPDDQRHAPRFTADEVLQVGLPQGLIASGFFANAYMVGFDRLLSSEINADNSTGEFVIKDYCRYVDDIRLVVEARWQEDTGQLESRVKELVSDVLKKHCDSMGAASSLLLNGDKTAATPYRSISAQNNLSALMELLQEAISGTFDHDSLTQAAGGLDGLLWMSEQLEDPMDRKASRLELANIAVPNTDVRDDTVKRFVATRISPWLSTFLSALLQWPGTEIRGGNAARFVNAKTRVEILELIQERIVVQRALYGGQSGTPMYIVPTQEDQPPVARPMRIAVVQPMLPRRDQFNDKEPGRWSKKLMAQHRRHLAEVCRLTHQKLKTWATAKDLGKEGDRNREPLVDLILFPELSVHPEHVSHLRVLSDKVKASIFAGLTFIDSPKHSAPINQGLWLIRTENPGGGRTFQYAWQGKKHPTPLEEKMGVKGYRPHQVLVEFPIGEGTPTRVSAAICYDATDLALVADLRDRSDMFLVAALNQDVQTFDNMVAALHFHMYQPVILANMGEFGGSTAQAPLRTPFQRDQAGYRKAETPVHEALQEALVNALVHADYSGQGGIVIDRFADRIEISNPGTLLLSREQILRGGVSECRNKSLQRMFQMLGVGDKAGSGIDKIRSGWASQHWRSPGLQETLRPDRVMLVLSMVSMLPQPTVDGLRQRFGPAFGKLKVDEVQALVTADLEGEVSNQRLQEMSSSHPVDITKVLQGLVRKGMLEPSGTGRGTRYRLVSGDSLHKAEDSSHKDSDSLHKTGDSSHWVATTVTDAMRVTAEPARQSSRIAPAKLEQILVSLCSGQFVPLDLLAEAVNRNAEGLRNRYLTPLVRQGRLRLRFPDRKNRPDQAYLAVGDK